MGLGGNEKDRDRLEEKDKDGMSEEDNELVCAGEPLSFSLVVRVPFEVEDDSADTRIAVASLFPRTPCFNAISPSVVAEEERERSDQLPASEAVLSMLVVLRQCRVGECIASANNFGSGTALCSGSTHAMEALEEHLRMQGENELDVDVEMRLPIADADWDLFILVLLRPTVS